MNDKLIIELLKQSVDLLYKNDSYLIEHSVHEQDISHRIAYYFENLLNNYSWYKKSSFNVDVEYNKNFDDSKRVYSNCCNCDSARCYIHQSSYHIDNYQSSCKPDIILHERGSNDNNILVIEIKKCNNECKDDFAKLSAFTCNASDYKYKIGIYINIDNQPSYKYFKNGQEVEENDL